MSEKIKVSLLHSSNLFGSERYALTIEVINLSDKPLSNIHVNAVLIPGKNLSYQEGKNFNDLSKYEFNRGILIREINLQVSEAFRIIQLQNIERTKSNNVENNENIEKVNTNDINDDKQKHQESNKLKKTPELLKLILLEILDSFFGRLIKIFFIVFSTIYLVPINDSNTLIESSQNHYKIPEWAKESTKVETWEDLQRVEEIIMNYLPEESFLKKSFSAAKQKLENLDKQSSSYRDHNHIIRSDNLYPGQTISFTFYCLASHLLSEKQYDTQFEISYNESDTQIVGIQNLRKTLTFQPSALAVPFGTMVGGILGFIAKTVLSSNSDFSWSISKFWSPLLGAIVLSWILAIVIRKTDDAKKKFITVEDFAGGVFVGAMTGLFSEQIIEYLKTLIPNGKLK